MHDDVRERLRRLPQIEVLLRHPDTSDLLQAYGRRAVADALRDEVDRVRAATRDGAAIPALGRIVAAAATQLVTRRSGRLQRVINATGVVLHTNLGRAPLSEEARRAVLDATGYTCLEYDLGTGGRGSRTRHLGDLAAELCGTEAATVVNNGAAALALALAAIAAGRGVVVSRGELIEIGGSYRLPEMMTAAGCRLVEVGTTNRTRASDYEAAIDEDTALLLKVHTSNYQIQGFTEEATPSELARIAHEHGLPFVHDLGSGLLRDVQEGPLAGEPSVQTSVSAGSDLVIFSGDKLLGGPQAGVLAGSGELVSRCARHPLARAMRVDKLQRAALEATFEAHLRSEQPVDVPVVGMLAADPASLRERAERLAARLGGNASVERVEAVVGGGALPGATLPSWAVVLASRDVEGLAVALRRGRPPVVARIDEGRVVLDLRSVPASEDDELVDLVEQARERTRVPQESA